MALPFVSIEKDWWVTQTLVVIFSMSCADALLFKGGTSLSKGWKLIERFSEDVDLALDRGYLGFSGNLTRKEVHKLRYASYDFLANTFVNELNGKFQEIGLANVIAKPQEVINHDQDPLVVEIYYPKLTEQENYLRPGILIEIGSRSLKEPYTPREVSSMVSEIFPDRAFSDSPINIPIVNPERTFLEKVFLLHEEFQRPLEKTRVERLSRHLYDIEKLSQTPYFQKALQGKELYNTIVVHRSKFAPLQGVDFSKHNPENIKIIPSDERLPLWERDYNEMVENMIYGERLSFNNLIMRISEIQEMINNVKWD